MVASLGQVQGLILHAAAGSAPSQVYYFHNDHLGTPQVITDESGQVVWKADYDPFGEANVVVQLIESNFRFPGQYLDSETELHYNYFRYYDPRVGRYSQADPAGQLLGSMNLYAYVSNDVVNAVDPRGLWIGQLSPPPPGYDPFTWPSGLMPNGNFWVRDPKGGLWIAHPEDIAHWQHWEKPGGGTWPPNSQKPWPTQKKPPYGEQSSCDLSGNAPEWKPSELTITDPLSPYNQFIPFMPTDPFPVFETPPVLEPLPLPL